MIRRVTLHNWRAFRHLDLELEPGTTFIVADNGIGKTSVVSGIHWGIFGELSGVDAWREARKAGGNAISSIQLELPDGRPLRITREASSARRRSFKAEIDGHELRNESELHGLLEEQLGANASVLSRLSVLSEGDIDQFVHDADLLQRHLAVVFGLDNLDSAADAADAIAVRARARAKELQSLVLSEDALAGIVTGDLSAIEEDLATAVAEMDSLSSELAAAKTARDLAAMWEQTDRTAIETAERRRELARQLAAHFGGDGDPSNLVRILSRAIESARNAADEQRMRLATVRARESVLLEHLTELATGADCPICLRPLDGRTAEHSRIEHERQLALLADERSVLESQTMDFGLKELLAIRVEVDQLPDPKEPTKSRPNATESQLVAVVAALTEKVEAAAARVAAVRDEQRNLKARLAKAESNKAARIGLVQAHRAESLAKAGAEALRNTSKEIVDRNVQPLEDALRERWKAIMRDRGVLSFRRGRPVLVQDSVELQLPQLSGSERAIASMLTRLLVLRGATRSRFVAFDEPFEHLDAFHRRSITASLINATLVGDMDQVLVTTYEEGIVRRMAEGRANARVLYVSDA